MPGTSAPSGIARLSFFARIACALLALATVAVPFTIAVSAQQRPTPAARAQAAIRLKAATFVPTRGEVPAIAPGLMIAGYRAGQRGYYIVQFPGPILDAWKSDVVATGAELLDYVPDFAFKVRMNPGQANRVARLGSVAWVGIYHPAYKLSPELVRGGTRAYHVRVERGVDPAVVGAAIASTGAQVLERSGSLVTITADPDQVDAVAHVLDVASIEEFLPRTKHNDYGGGVILGANIAGAKGFDGSTQIIAIADTGLGNGVAESAYADIPPTRIVGLFNWPGSLGACFTSITDDGAADVDTGHGTHTATSALGSGGPGGEGRGAAPGANLVFQAVENWATTSLICQLFGLFNGYYLVGIPSDIRPLFQQGYDHGARIHSNSWGSQAAGAYTTDSVNADDFVWNHRNMTITFAAGNSGTDANADGVIDLGSIGSPATAKNVISVGASENDRQGHWDCDAGLTYTNCAAQAGQNSIFTYGATWPATYPANPIKDDPSAGDAEQMAAFSSRGPTDDGRIKPDVVAPGTWVLSGYSDKFQQQYDSSQNPQNKLYQYDGWGYPLNQYYKYMGGTSMSNPLVAGGAAIVRDYYEKTAAHIASAALVKATLVNSAVDLLDENNDGLEDNAYPIPNNHEGWGRADLAHATDGGRQYFDETVALSTGSSGSFTFPIDAAGSPFKVTLAWSDFPSTASAAKNLVNDLDLKVTAPDGTTYLGNVFGGGWSLTGGSADRTNNLENVYVASASAGTWMVEVSGFNIPSGPQPFALVADGKFSGPASVLPRVTVAATDPFATEAGQTTGTFTVTRSGDTTAALTVRYTTAGTATAGSDYPSLPGVVTIPAGSSDATIDLTPTDDALVEPDETVTLTLVGDAAYTLGSPAYATMTITSNDVPPDLVVSALTVPPIAGAGAIMTVTDTTANSGAGPALASSTGFYLSANILFDSADVLLGKRSVPALPAGGTSTSSTNLQIPSGTVTGTYYVLAVADVDSANPETQENNNTRVSVGVKVGPDLVVSALTVPATAGGGATIVVGDTTKNQGGGDAAGTATRFYLSTNLILDAADILLGGRSVPPLPPNGSDAGSTSIVIPSSTATGTYYVLAQADADAIVAETMETNNVKFTSSVTIGPDLIVSSLTVPALAGAGASLAVTDTTKNQGAGGASGSTTVFYLSLNLSLETSDVPFGSRVVPPLVSGATSTVSTTLTIPSGTATGTYYVLAEADANNAIAETSETNNVKFSFSMKVGPDLTITSVTAPTTTVAGTTVTVTDTTKNQGGGSAPASTTRFYLSTNLWLDASDALLGGRPVRSLGPGLSDSGSVPLIIPSGTPAGTYYVITAADGTGVVVETIETNNTWVRSIRITAAP